MTTKRPPNDRGVFSDANLSADLDDWESGFDSLFSNDDQAPTPDTTAQSAGDATTVIGNTAAALDVATVDILATDAPLPGAQAHDALTVDIGALASELDAHTQTLDVELAASGVSEETSVFYGARHGTETVDEADVLTVDVAIGQAPVSLDSHEAATIELDDLADVETSAPPMSALRKRQLADTSPPPASHVQTAELSLDALARESADGNAAAIDDDDDFPEIEVAIGPVAETVTPVAAPKRLANVVRRRDSMTPVPMPGEPAASGSGAMPADGEQTRQVDAARAERATGKFDAVPAEANDFGSIPEPIDEPSQVSPHDRDDHADHADQTSQGDRQQTATNVRSTGSSIPVIVEADAEVAVRKQTEGGYVPLLVELAANAPRLRYDDATAEFRAETFIDGDDASVFDADEAIDWLAVVERELAATDVRSTAAALRQEAGLVAAQLGYVEQARAHLEAALQDAPTAVPAISGLLVLALWATDAIEFARLLEMLHELDGRQATPELAAARLAAGEANRLRELLDTAHHLPSPSARHLLAAEHGLATGDMALVRDSILQLSASADALGQSLGLAAVTFGGLAPAHDDSIVGTLVAADAAYAAGQASQAASKYLELANQLGPSAIHLAAGLRVRANLLGGPGVVVDDASALTQTLLAACSPQAMRAPAATPSELAGEEVLAMQAVADRNWQALVTDRLLGPLANVHATVAATAASELHVVATGSDDPWFTASYAVATGQADLYPTTTPHDNPIATSALLTSATDVVHADAASQIVPTDVAGYYTMRASLLAPTVERAEALMAQGEALFALGQAWQVAPSAWREQLTDIEQTSWQIDALLTSGEAPATSPSDPRMLGVLAIDALGAAKGRQAAELVAEGCEHAASISEGTPAAVWRYRASQLRFDMGDAQGAHNALDPVADAWASSAIVQQALGAVRRKLGVTNSDVKTSLAALAMLATAAGQDAARRDHAYVQAMLAVDQGLLQHDATAAKQALAVALELRPADPFAMLLSEVLGDATNDATMLTSRAHGAARHAEQLNDTTTTVQSLRLLAKAALAKNDLAAARNALSEANSLRGGQLATLDQLVAVAAAAGDLDGLATWREQQAAAVEHAQLGAAYRLDAASVLELQNADSKRIIALTKRSLTDWISRAALLATQRHADTLNDQAQSATIADQVAELIGRDERARAAFVTRAGAAWAAAGQYEQAIERYRLAATVVPGYLPALVGWRRAGLRGELWLEVAEAALAEAAVAQDVATKVRLMHLAGVVLMDKALVPERAIVTLRDLLRLAPTHHDGFVRLRMLLEEEGDHDQLALLLESRLLHEADVGKALELHRACADIQRNFLSNREGAIEHYRAVLEHAPRDVAAQMAIADMAWEVGDWDMCAEVLTLRAGQERAPETLRNLANRLGVLYAERLHDLPKALRWYEKALSAAPQDEAALTAVANLASQTKDWNKALAAAERLIRLPADADDKVSHWHRAATILDSGFGDARRAEKAYQSALDAAPNSQVALDELLAFYRRKGDNMSMRVHLGRIAGALRARLATAATDHAAYQQLGHAMRVRGEVFGDGAEVLADAAAELAAWATWTSVEAAGAASDGAPKPNPQAIAVPASLGDANVDERLFPAAALPELRKLLTLLADKLAKQAVADLRDIGVSRADKAAATEAVTRVSQQCATGLGLGELDVYVSQKQPWAFAAMAPNSLAIGAEIVALGPNAIAFAATAACLLLHRNLALPARLPQPDLAALTVGLVRLFQPDFPPSGADADAIAAQVQKLRRLIPANQLAELRPFALAVDPSRFTPAGFSAAVIQASHRAGLAACGSVAAAVMVLAGKYGVSRQAALTHPDIAPVIAWALSDDHAEVRR